MILYLTTLCAGLTIQVLDVGINKTSDVSYNDAFVVTISEVVGELPEDDLIIDEDDADLSGTEGKAVTGFTLALANDGINFSDEYLFLIYDGKCLTCNSSSEGKLCTRKVSIIILIILNCSDLIFFSDRNNQRFIIRIHIRSFRSEICRRWFKVGHKNAEQSVQFYKQSNELKNSIGNFDVFIDLHMCHGLVECLEVLNNNFIIIHYFRITHAM